MRTSALALTVACLCALPGVALADNNFANVVQTGDGNDGVVTQGPGSGNWAGNDGLAIRQAGNGNRLTFLQSGSNNTIGTSGTGFLQSSNRNSAGITQTSGGNSVVSVTQAGIGSPLGGDGLRRNILTVLQEIGDGNSIASVEQRRGSLSPRAAANEATLTQSGAANRIGTVLQSGHAESVTIAQTGSGNAVERTEQRGSRNAITISLNGNSNGTLDFVAGSGIIGAWGGLAQGHVYQNNDALLAGLADANRLDFSVTGSSNSFGFSQIGADNTIGGTIGGSGNQTGVSQIGLSNDARFEITGADNLLFIDQGLWAINYSNVADVAIDGSDNQIGIRQGGSSNDARLDIAGGGNLVNLTQESLLWGNDARLAINGSNNLLTASQNGGRNSLAISIFGSNNNRGSFTAGEPAFAMATLLSPALVPGDVVQNGSRNSITYTLGTGLAAANDNRFAFWQNGDGNVIEGSTQGSANEVVILQHGNGNFTYFSQSGVGNIIGVSQ